MNAAHFGRLRNSVVLIAALIAIWQALY